MLRLVIFPANVEPSRFLDVIITPAVSNRELPGMVIVRLCFELDLRQLLDEGHLR
jgi:hypothetical protein